jgi:hypothetical protein
LNRKLIFSYNLYITSGESGISTYIEKRKETGILSSKKEFFQAFKFRSCEKDVLIQSKSGAVDICAMHARARGASGRYAQEKECRSLP